MHTMIYPNCPRDYPLFLHMFYSLSLRIASLPSCWTVTYLTACANDNPVCALWFNGQNSLYVDVWPSVWCQAFRWKWKILRIFQYQYSPQNVSEDIQRFDLILSVIILIFGTKWYPEWSYFETGDLLKIPL